MELSEGEILKLVSRHDDWFHSIELPFNIITPGTANSEIKEQTLKDIGLPDNMLGLRVLDVGCMDGYFSFALERRGASVVAMDRRPLKGSKIETAILCLNSNIEYVNANVYDLHPSWIGTFDCVLFLGVIYHLRHPLLALEAIRSVLPANGLLFVNTLLLDEFLTMPDGTTSKLRNESATLRSVPLWQMYPGQSLAGDITNEFVPNMAAVRASLGDTQFKPVAEQISGIGGFVKAEAIIDPIVRAWTIADRGSGAPVK
jgi:tRNA (mo5U34)-methyltransferase